MMAAWRACSNCRRPAGCRRYRVRVHGKVDEKALAGLKDGTAVDGVFYGGIEATLDREQGSNAWLTIGLREGKNREVKNILGALGLDVTRLIRISYGPFQLGELPEGARAGAEGPHAARPARRAADRGVRRQFRGAGGGPVLQQAGARRAGAASRVRRAAEDRARRRAGPHRRGRADQGPQARPRRRRATNALSQADHAARRATVVQEGAAERSRRNAAFKKEPGFRKDDGFRSATSGKFGRATSRASRTSVRSRRRSAHVECLDGAGRTGPQGKKSAEAAGKPRPSRPRQAGEPRGAPKAGGGKAGGKGKSGADRRR